MRIKITSSSIGDVFAELSEKSPKTVKAIWDALPVEARANTWGDEIYFAIPVNIEAENQQAVVDIGDLGYWPPGNAFCIFFGPTPASRGNEIRPASPVNVFGKVDGDSKIFKKVRSGDTIILEKA